MLNILSASGCVPREIVLLMAGRSSAAFVSSFDISDISISLGENDFVGYSNKRLWRSNRVNFMRLNTALSISNDSI